MENRAFTTAPTPKISLCLCRLARFAIILTPKKILKLPKLASANWLPRAEGVEKETGFSGLQPTPLPWNFKKESPETVSGFAETFTEISETISGALGDLVEFVKPELEALAWFDWVHAKA